MRASSGTLPKMRDWLVVSTREGVDVQRRPSRTAVYPARKVISGDWNGGALDGFNGEGWEGRGLGDVEACLRLAEREVWVVDDEVDLRA